MPGRFMVSVNCRKRGLSSTGLAPGFQLSGSFAKAKKKLAAHRPDAIQPGVEMLPSFRPSPPSAGPKMKPNPKAMPISPIFFDRSSGGVTSAI